MHRVGSDSVWAGYNNSNGNGTGINRESLSTNHTVNLPINTTSSCKNVCGPLARCSITGEQCSTDVDCFGCQPIINNVSTSSTVQIGNNNIRGQNDAGKLTNAETPTYSTLTTDIGSRAQLFNKQTISAPKYFQGVNIWREKYDVAKSLYSSRYASADANQYIKYPKRETLSGEFEDDGPLAANAYLH